VITAVIITASTTAFAQYKAAERYQPGWIDPREAVIPTWQHCEDCDRETPHLHGCVYAAWHQRALLSAPRESRNSIPEVLP
jgi:hypothetical protein